MAIVKADATASLLAVDMEETTVARNAPGVDLAIWKEFSDDPIRVMADHLRKLGLSRAKIGIEMDYLPAGDYARLRGYLPDAVFEAAEQALSRLRQIKTADEVALLRRLSRIADQAIGDALAAVRIVATGERSQLPNVGPSERRLQRGDVCRIEIFSVIGGYQAGVCRTAYVQEPPPMAEAIWQVMVDCKYRTSTRGFTLRSMRPRAPTC